MEITQRLDAAIGRMHEPWGGALSLDFANTLEPRGGPPPVTLPEGYVLRDELRDYDELVGWTAHKNEMPREQALGLLTAADAAPDAAAAVLTRAHALRDAIYRACWAIAHHETPAQADLDIIASEHADAAAHATLRPQDGHAVWAWHEDDVALARPLWPVAWSAVELLTSAEPRRIKVCPGPGRDPLPCAWLFYDTSKNASRRWCSMSDCGSATKARLQMQRRRARRSPA